MAAEPRTAAATRGGTFAFRDAALFLLLCVVGLRPLVGESYDTAQDVISSGLSELAPPMPIRTLVIDAVILAIGAAVLASRWRARAWRRCGLEWGFLILVVAAAISCACAHQRRLAVNASLDWLCLPVLAMALLHLVTDAWRGRLVLGVVLASSSANAVECLVEKLYTLPQTRSFYLEHREAFWRERGVPLDSAMVRMYEARMMADQPDGFFYHGNVAAGYLGMGALVLAGVAAQSLRRHSPRLGGADGESSVVGWAGVMLAVGVVLFIAAILLTGSVGATAAVALSAVAWVVMAIGRNRRGLRRIFELCGTHRRASFVAAWAGIAAISAAVIGHGIRHGSLPGASLNFRWQYWTASAELIRDHSWTGVGRENFGRHYLQYKSIRSPEEVASPHNLFVQAAADWGLPGLIGMLGLLIGGSATLAGIRWPRKDNAGGREVKEDGALRRGSMASVSRARAETDLSEDPKIVYNKLAWTGGLAAAIFVIRLPLLGSNDAAFLLVETFTPVLVWTAAFLLVVMADSAAPPAIPVPAIAAGLFAFLLQDTVNFALFVPAAATAAFALYAVAVAGRTAVGAALPRPDVQCDGQEGAERTAGRLRSGAAVAAGVLLLIVAAWQLVPVATGNAALAEARRLAMTPPTTGSEGPSAGEVMDAFSRAARSDGWDPTPWVEQAEWLASGLFAGSVPFARTTVARIRSSFEEAQRRDPVRADLWRRAARFDLQAAGRLRADPSTPLEAIDELTTGSIEAAQRVTRLYPQDPSAWRLLGECQARIGDWRDDQALLTEAARSLKRCLELDAARPEWEVIRRLSVAERAGVEDLLAGVRERLDAAGGEEDDGPAGGA